MSYIPVYSTRINWENEPSIVSPINATNLNKMDYALKAHDDTLANWDITKANESDLLLALKEVSYDTDTGVFVFTWFNGTTSTIDLNIEKIPVSFSMDANGVITMTTEDGTTYTADVGALIKTYTFTDSSVIDFTVTTDASGNKTVTADIVNGSIDGTKLTPNYLADCTQAKTGAETAATNSAASSQDAEAWAVGTRGGVPVPSTDPAYENNAEYWAHHTSSSLAGLSDVDLNNPSDGEVLKYNGTTSKWENGQAAAGGGSTIAVSTSESALYGQNITITDGVTTLTGAFDNTGHATFSGVTMTGNLTIACGTASTSLNVPYFGNYTAVVSSFSASITVTYPGGTCTCVGNGESYTASGSPYTFTVHGAATYTITVTIDGVSKTDTAVITTDGQTETSTIEFGTINVTYENDFRGVSITCTLGGTTITKTAPSAGNTMSFYPPTTGQWTISGTVGGVPYPTTANVTSLSTPVSVNLETIPDGSTATPTDDIQKWLACAGIKDKSYTTLAEVLADSVTFNALLGDSNACAYMKRSTTWAGGVKVPTMTDNTHPSGVASGIIYGSVVNNDAWKAFDGNTSTTAGQTYLSNYSPNGGYLQYQFTSAVIVNKCYVRSEYYTGHSDGYGIKGIVVSASNDGSTFTQIATSTRTDNSNPDYSFSFENSTAYQYYRVEFPDNVSAGIYVGVTGLQFLNEGLTDDQYAMNLLGQYDTACDALLSDSTWASAIANSTYFESVLNVKVPVMTSNTTPEGEVFCNTVQPNYAAYEAFDGVTTGGGYGMYTSTSQFVGYVPETEWIGYKFTSPVKICRVDYKNSQYAQNVKFYFEGKNDADANWTRISGELTAATSDAWTTFVFTNNGAFNSNRCLYTAGEGASGGSNIPNVREIQFYGRATSSEKIHGGNPTYDSFYRIVDGNNVPVTDPSLLDAGTYTIYSNGLAKNPSNLSNDYGKTIRICPNTKEIVVRPDKTLYWYGVMPSIGEDLISANGWSWNQTMTAGTHNAQDIQFASSSNVINGVASKYSIGATTVHAIYNGLTASSNVYGYLLNSTTKSNSGINDTQTIGTSGLSHSTLSATGGYAICLAQAGMAGKLSALWYE